MTRPKATFAGLALIAALCAGFTLGLTAPAWADFLDGYLAYIRGDYAAALREWRPLAEQGHAGAQYRLGLMYYNKGQGVPQDYVQAVKWYRKAAEQGYADAQFKLGVMYSDGQGVPQDDAEAVRWYRKAAEQGVAIAQFILGDKYSEGRGVSKDYVETVRWWRKAAEQGFAVAQHNLGLMYGNGQGVPEDYVQAHMWYDLAASGFPPGEARDRAARKRDKVAERMTPEQVAEAQKLAREWRPK